MINREGLSISPERSRVIREDIATGSEPGLRFYIMVVLSTLIAGFGLVMSSTAVIIGAMLVAPLMTPIFGMALGLIRGDFFLFGRAARAELVGVIGAILMGYLLGISYGNLEPTTEMLVRTKPFLFDLLVAVFSGCAGAYALVDEKLSPALPGVAIATAIVPPLANTGLCLSVGAYSGAFGSFLLFFSNFLSILLVASFVFWYFRLYEKYQELSMSTLFKRFALPALGFLVISVFLFISLVDINRDRQIRNTIKDTLLESTTELPSSKFDKMVYSDAEEKIYVYAQIYSAIPLSPIQVSRIENLLTEKLAKPVELTIQSKIAQTVSALNANNQMTEIDLDGHFLRQEPKPIVMKTRIADSTIRNFFADHLGAEIISTRILRLEGHDVVLANMTGFLTPTPESIMEVEELLKKKLATDDLTLVVQYHKPEIYNRDGHMLLDFGDILSITKEQQEKVDQIEAILAEDFTKRKGVFLSNVDFTIIDNELIFFLEVHGTRLLTIEEVERFENMIQESTGEKVNIYALNKVDTVISKDGNQSYNELSKKIYEKTGSKLKESMKKIIETSNL